MRCVGLLVDGGGCPFNMEKEVAGVPLCYHHLRAVREALAPPAASAPPVEGAEVYYMGCPDRQLVKIGTTTNLKARWQDHRSTYPNVLLLATEPGRYSVETRRHRQFASLLASTVSREWFRKAPVLMQHIADLRARHGIIHPSRHRVPEWGIAPLKPLVAA